MNFHWLDLAILVILALSLLRGLAAGLMAAICGVVAAVGGIAVAAGNYARGGTWLAEQTPLPQPTADLCSFIFLFLVTAAAVHFLGALLSAITRVRVFKIIDRVGGAAAGLLMGAVLIGIILLLLTSFPLLPGLQEQMEEASLAPSLRESSRSLYEAVINLLPARLPSLAYHPEELWDYFQQAQPKPRQQQRLDFQQLDGSTCFACGDRVVFLGYLANPYGSVSPKFRCNGCGRTSDGCQTFEGHHLMYEQCPAVLGRRGYRFDCGIWTNHSYLRPTGTCPVCGERS